MPADVPNALLRRVAWRCVEEFEGLCVVATAGHVSSAIVLVPRRNFICDCRGQASAERRDACANCEEDDPARGRNPGSRDFVPASGVCYRLGLGAMERFVSRGYFELHRCVADAAGPFVLG